MGISLPFTSLRASGKRTIRFAFVLTFSLAFSFAALAQNGSVGIGTNIPKEHAVLDITSSDKGLLVPRLSTGDAENLKNKLLALKAPNTDYNGLLIYNSTDSTFNVWKADKWEAIGGEKGASAYEVWEALPGNAGKSEDDFFASLKGDNGDKGEKGIAGATWFTEKVDPTATFPSTARDGDYYLNTVSGDVFKRTLGSWGSAIGNLIVGTPGKDGKTITKASVNTDGAFSFEYEDGTGFTASGTVKGEQGVGVDTAVVTGAGQLNITLTDGSIVNAGPVKGTDGKDGTNGIGVDTAIVTGTGLLEITLTDGSKVNAGPVKGTDGTDGANGIGVDTAVVTGAGLLEITLTDGSKVNAGPVKGTDGTNGIGVDTAVVTGAGLLEITLTDGSKVNAGPVKGTDGTNGIGVDTAVVTGAGLLEITLTDGSKVNAGNVKGADGSKWYVGTTVPDNATGVNGDFYFQEGTNIIWEKQAGAWVDTGKKINPSNAWSLTGNSGTAGDISTYLGTADAQPLIIGTNGTETMRVLVGGNVGINTETPTAKLHISGDVKIGLQGDAINKVLKASISRNISSIAAGAQKLESFSMPNCSMNSIVTISPEKALPPGVIISYARVATAAVGALPGTVEVAFWNANTTAQDPEIMKFNITVVE